MKKKSATFKVVNLNKRKTALKGIIVFLAIFITLSLYMHFIATPLIIKSAEAQIKVYADRAVISAVSDAMNRNITYDDLIHIVTDSSGKISMIQANSIQINTLSKIIGKNAIDNLNLKSKLAVLVSIGAFTGVPALSGIGPKIPFNIQPYGDANCVFESKFLQAGINQTQHKIYLNVNCEISAVLPFKKIVVNSSSDVLICESVIIGDIPSTYLRSSNLTDMLALVP
ncbi:MAG: sporulation protein YunB [Clostridia bacterium]|nr:sporulation protein YunB [Clostridia bacterium]